MKYKVDLDKIKSEIPKKSKHHYSEESFYRIASAKIVRNLNRYIFIEGIIVDSNVLDILYSSQSFSCPETKIVNNLLLVGSFVGNDVYLECTGFLKENEYTILNDPQYIQHIEKLKLNKKIKKISKI